MACVTLSSKAHLVISLAATMSYHQLESRVRRLRGLAGE